jgi:hypothetical protein
MENPRTTSARDHDDSAMIDAIEPGTTQQGSSGGNLATDIASQAEQAEIADPEATTRAQKSDDIHNGAAERSDRPRGA